MAEAGLLASAEARPGYAVGNLIFETSRRHRAHSTLSVLADEALARIVEAPATPDTSPCSMAPICSACDAAGQQAVARRDLAGRSAAGFLLLDRPRDAGAPRRRGGARAAIAAPLQPPSPNAPQTIDDLLAALAVVREKGWSQATDEACRASKSIAVCVQDHESGEQVAICISYSAAMISANEKPRIVTLLMRAGCELGTEIRRRVLDGAALRRLFGAVLE